MHPMGNNLVGDPGLKGRFEGLASPGALARDLFEEKSLRRGHRLVGGGDDDSAAVPEPRPPPPPQPFLPKSVP